MSFHTKCGAGHSGDMTFFQQQLAKCDRVRHFVAKMSRNIGKHVKRSLRLVAAKAGHSRKCLRDVFPPPRIFRIHKVYRALVSFHRFDPRHLADRRWIGCSMALQFVTRRDDFCRPNGIAQSPSGHSVSLGKRIYNKRQIASFREKMCGCDMLVGRKNKTVITFIKYNIDVLLRTKFDNVSHRFARNNGPGGIVGTVQDQNTRPG